MKMKDLKSFEVVYQEQCINQAAKKLYITPQGLSKNIKNLETELNTILFERTMKGLKPTKSAEYLYENVEVLIHQFEMVENGIKQLSNNRIRLRIGLACGVFHVLPFRIILNFCKENPEIEVNWCEYSNQEVKKMIDSCEIEYGFVVGGCENQEVLQRKLASRKVCLLVYEGHPLFNRRVVSVNDLKEEPVLVMNEHFNMYHDFMEACQVRGFTPDVVAKTADGSILHKLCMQKIGLAIIPDFVLDDLVMDHLRAIPFEETLTWDVYGVYEKKNRSYETIKKFENYLKQHFE